MSALLEFNYLTPTEGENKPLEADICLIIPQVKHYNPTVLEHNDFYQEYFNIPKSYFDDYNIKSPFPAGYMDNLKDTDSIQHTLPCISIHFKGDAYPTALYFYTQEKAQKVLDAIKVESEDFYKNSNAYVAQV